MTTETERKTLRQRIADSSLQMSATFLGEFEDNDGGRRWPHYRWRLTLRRSGRRMTLTWRAGIAHDPNEKPRLIDVIEVLLSEASGVEDAVDFRDWCSTYGYEVESPSQRRRGEQMYYATAKQRDRLKNLLGDDYAAWLWETDREDD